MDAVLIVESEEAHRLADEREKGDRDLEERLRKLREITAEIRRCMAEPKITSDHSWLYDEHGLPR
jgi:hypothetical protein